MPLDMEYDEAKRLVHALKELIKKERGAVGHYHDADEQLIEVLCGAHSVTDIHCEFVDNINAPIYAASRICRICGDASE